MYEKSIQVTEILTGAEEFFKNPLNKIIDTESYVLSGVYTDQDKGEFIKTISSLEQKLSEGKMDSHNIIAITTAVSEAIQNAKEHTLAWDKESKIYLEAIITDTYDLIAIISEGKEFKLNTLKHLLESDFDIIKEHEKKKSQTHKDRIKNNRGYGWKFIKKTSDIIIYSGYFNQETGKYHTNIILGKNKH